MEEGKKATPTEASEELEVTKSGIGEKIEESDSLTSLVGDLQAQLLKAQNDMLYLRAEFDNYRRQAIKERSDLVKYAGERLAKDLLETLDIFETALESEVTTESFSSFVKGVELTANQLKSTLAKHGICPIDSLGKPFDPNHHEALGSEVTDTMPPGSISKVFKKPYKYQDKLLRHGQVIVAKEKDSQ